MVTPIINMVAISAKAVVARIMEALGAGNVVVEEEEEFIINQMFECYNCHKRDHYANECRSKGDNHAFNCAQEDSNHEQDEEDHEVLMTTTSNETPNNQTWYLDTGCTNHMCG